jgi:hypothetical protein
MSPGLYAQSMTLDGVKDQCLGCWKTNLFDRVETPWHKKSASWIGLGKKYDIGRVTDVICRVNLKTVTSNRSLDWSLTATEWFGGIADMRAPSISERPSAVLTLLLWTRLTQRVFFFIKKQLCHQDRES